MIRLGTYKGKEYITVSTTIRVDREAGNVSVPMLVQIDISKLTEEDRITVFKKADKVFNHILVIKDEVKPLPNVPRKRWWNRFLNR